MNTGQKDNTLPTESTGASEQQHDSASAQSTYDKDSIQKEKFQDMKPKTKKEKVRHFTHVVLDGIVKGGTFGGMGT